MVAQTLRTLMHPFEIGTLPPPQSGGKVLFLGAEPGLRLPEDFPRDILAVQGFKPLFLGLQRQGITVAAAAEGDGFAVALVLAGRHRGENELRIAEAIQRTAHGGLIVIAGGKDDGVASLRKRLESNDDDLAESIAGRQVSAPVIERGGVIESTPERLYNPGAVAVPLGGHLSKYHGVVFWLQRTPEAETYAGAVKKWYGDWPLVDRRFHAAPGMFSHDRIDRGSSLLAAHLPSEKLGKVADFCAGWGYLTSEVAKQGSAKTVDLYEADHASLEAAKANLAETAGPQFRFFWHDLASEPVAERYDTIVMNPPFHTGRAAEPQLGQKLIAVAAAALRPKGRLFLVANRGLPYDKALTAHFSSYAQIANDGGFRVTLAIR